MKFQKREGTEVASLMAVYQNKYLEPVGRKVGSGWEAGNYESLKSLEG